ncbi:MAG: hypothetical protein ACAI35_10060 [Candidatus Methylacidiphilales bacterium]
MDTKTRTGWLLLALGLFLLLFVWVQSSLFYQAKESFRGTVVVAGLALGIITTLLLFWLCKLRVEYLALSMPVVSFFALILNYCFSEYLGREVELYTKMLTSSSSVLGCLSVFMLIVWCRRFAEQ